MLPTFGVGDEWVLVARLPYLRRPPYLKRGDLVTALSPENRNKCICKRVIGLEGDTVCTDPSGTVRSKDEHIVIPKGHVWLAGDNMRHSNDSRYFGPVPLALIQGRLVARIWPNPHIFRNPMTAIDE